MTIKELVARLAQYDPEVEVKIYDVGVGAYQPVIGCAIDQYCMDVWLLSEED